MKQEALVFDILRKVLADGASTTLPDIYVFKFVKIDFVNNFRFLKFVCILLSKNSFPKYLDKIASSCKWYFCVAFYGCLCIGN